MAAKTQREQIDERDDSLTDYGVITDRFDVATLQNIESFDDAVALLTREYGDVQDASRVIGTGFALVDTNGKMRLQGVPFVIVHVMFPQSMEYKNDDGTPAHYVVAHIVTEDGRKMVLTDGGVGIYAQLEEWSLRSERRGGLLVKGGLRASTYRLPDDSGDGTTYYLAV